MFFAYSRNKYEELVCKAIRDAKEMPTEILKHFRHGEWTVSVTGTPFCNVALDEAHEMLVNR
jgi:hypothetical protein